MNETKLFDLFATTPKGLEGVLLQELMAMGAQQAGEKLSGVTFKGDLQLAYRACLWSRFANRILLKVGSFPSSTPEDLYAGVSTIKWSDHMAEDGTLAVHFISSQSEITHTLFGAQKVKDAIVDQFRDATDTRPSVSKSEPDVSIYVYLYRDTANIYIDLSGESLHKRGYRLEAGSAPLKENLAAAILYRAGWPAIAETGGALMDPMCGSGTLLIEAALMAANHAPGLGRNYFGFLGWKQHDPVIWKTLVNEATEIADRGMQALPPIVGYDQDGDAISIAISNIERAGLHGKIHVEKREISSFSPHAGLPTGLVVTNPPYGERLGDEVELQGLYKTLGAVLKAHFAGWKAAVFTGNPPLGKQMGLKAKKYYALMNGAIPCQLLLFSVEESFFVDNSEEAENERRIRTAKRKLGEPSATVEMFMNRVQKNKKHLAKKAEQQGLQQYTVYDSDLPEYRYRIEMQERGATVFIHPAPQHANQDKIQTRKLEMLSVIADALEISPRHVYLVEEL